MKERSLIRRAGLTIGSGFLAAAAITGCDQPKPIVTPKPAVQDIMPVSSPAAMETVIPASAETIILAKAAELGVKPSTKEQSLWANSYKYKRVDSAPPVTSDDLKVAQERYFSTLDLMGKSENEILSNTSNKMLSITKTRSVEFSFQDDPTSSIGFSGSFDPESGKFVPRLDLSAQLIRYHSDALTLAGQIVNTFNTVFEMMDFADSLPENMTSESKLAALEDFLSTRDDVTGRSYGLEALANIKEAGLLGRVITVEGSGSDERAEYFILSGMNPASEEWKNYIEKINTPNPFNSDQQIA
jgi:hypothetical protein